MIKKNQPTNLTGYVSVGLIFPAKTILLTLLPTNSELKRLSATLSFPPCPVPTLNTWVLVIFPTLKDIHILQILIYRGNLSCYLLILTLIRKFTTTS